MGKALEQQCQVRVTPGDSALRLFFKELSISKSSCDKMDSWTLVCDKAKVPHKSLRKLCRAKGNKNSRSKRTKIAKSLSSSIIPDDDAMDMIPFQLLNNRPDHSKQRWEPLPPAPILMARKWRLQKEQENAAKEQDPLNLRDASPGIHKPQRKLSMAKNEAAPPLSKCEGRSISRTENTRNLYGTPPQSRPRTPTSETRGVATILTKPKRQPSIQLLQTGDSPTSVADIWDSTKAVEKQQPGGKDFCRSSSSNRKPPPPPLHSRKNTEQGYLGNDFSRINQCDQDRLFLRVGSDSSLVCPRKTGKTLKSSRPCYKVVWVKDVNHRYVRELRPKAS